jgi:predicted small secreted protein
MKIRLLCWSLLLASTFALAACNQAGNDNAEPGAAPSATAPMSTQPTTPMTPPPSSTAMNPPATMPPPSSTTMPAPTSTTGG